MTLTLYYSRTFVTLHQKNPGYNPGNNEGNPYLTAGGVETSTRKYLLEAGFGDPGEEPYFDNYDYSEFAINFATFEKPKNYGERATYSTEALGGGTYVNSYAIWGVVTVPDTFIMPAEYLNPSATDYVNAALDDARSEIIDYFRDNAEPGVIPPLSKFAAELNNSYGLYGTLKTHMERQFDAINRVLSGDIDVDTFQRLTDDASLALVADLTAGNYSSLLAEAVKSVVADLGVMANPIDNIVKTAIGFNSIEGFVGPEIPAAVLHQVVGSASDDTLTEYGLSGDIVIGGLGNDWIKGLEGSGILVGGRGKDTLDYGSMRISLEMDIDISDGYARAKNFFFWDRIAGFENALGGSQGDTISGSKSVNYLNGLGGNDVLLGRGGGDRIYGSTGYDWLYGDAGSDSLEGGLAADLLDGGEGIDTAMFSGTFNLLTLRFFGVYVSLKDPALNTGEAAGDIFFSVENLSGTPGEDILIGDRNSNRLWGEGENDELNGGLGNDFLSGGLGKDLLTGGQGMDEFIFDYRPRTSNADVVTDFNEDQDTIVLDQFAFDKLALGRLSSSAFFAGKIAHDSSDRIIYDQSSGELFYDGDGNGAQFQMLIAKLLGEPDISSFDVYVA